MVLRLFSQKTVNIALWVLLGLAGAYVSARWLLPWLWPFLLAWSAAAALEPAVGRLTRRGWKRPMAAGLCCLLFLGAAGGLLWLLLLRLFRELGELIPRFPGMLAAASETLQGWEERAEAWIARAPEGLSLWIERALAGLKESLDRLPGALTGRLFALLSAAAAAAPSALLFAVTALIGAYFISAAYPELLHGAARLLPEGLLCRARLLRRDLRRTLGRWLKARGLMALITCGVLAGAFFLLRLRYALLLAIVTAVVDALPVLGAGTVLLPWALWCFLTGDPGLGSGLVITYAAVTVLNSCIQAKLLGDQLGLHPLATLAAIYAGWKSWGVWGMLLFPIAAICLKQALPGLRQFWKEKISA